MSVLKDRKTVASIVTLMMATIAMANRPACQVALDADSNWVQIGDMYWLRENTRCIEYDTEAEAYNAVWLKNNTLPLTLEEETVTPYYADYSAATKPDAMDDEQFGKLGMMYNWAAAAGTKNDATIPQKYKTKGCQGICPNGSHLPTKAELESAVNYLKELSLMTGGLATSSNHFMSVGKSGYIWSSTSFSNPVGYAGHITAKSKAITVMYSNKYAAMNVRCVKNSDTEQQDSLARTPSGKVVTPARYGSQYAGSVTDACGEVYPLVTIGTQVWMAENMRCNKYEQGVSSGDYLYPFTSGSKYNPYYETMECDTCGYLYNWAAAMGYVAETEVREQIANYDGKCQGICPNGFHVPSKADWNTLKTYIKGETEWHSAWDNNARFWSEDARDAFSAYNYVLYDRFPAFDEQPCRKSEVRSVRCVRDEQVKLPGNKIKPKTPAEMLAKMRQVKK